MPTKGYQSYRGRMPGWKKLLVVILTVLLVGAVVVLCLEHNQVFDSHGVHLRLPFSDQKEPAPESNAGEDTPGGDDDLVIDIQQPENTLSELHGRALDAAQLQTETFAALTGDERPVLTMKAANAAALAIDDEAGAALVREKISGRNAVAVMACFADAPKADSDEAMAVMSRTTKAWRDPGGNTWLDPYNADVTAYLNAMVQEYAAMGFTEIVLTDVQFPNYGVLKNVVYNDREDTAETRIAAINAFLDTLHATAEQAGVLLSMELPASLLDSGTDETAGWDLAQIATRVDRIYMSVADQSAADSARTALAALRSDADAGAFFVAETAAPVTGGSYVIS